LEPVSPWVFISYSWDSPAHKRWVRQLAARLVTNGVKVGLDQWDIGPGDSLTKYMEEQIAGCDRVLVICTPEYAIRSNQRQGGVGFEQQIISGQIAAGLDRRKFIPILRRGEIEPGPMCAIPTHLSGSYAIDMRRLARFEKQLDVLLHAIYGRPILVPPAIGSPPAHLQNAAPVEATRLPLIELDGWQLESGVARNEMNPSFEIPPEHERRSVRKGDLVKLLFEIEVLPDPDDKLSSNQIFERMWVKTTGTEGPYYKGVLDNVPIASEESDVLKYGSEVTFLPEHIIDIVDVAEQEVILRERRRVKQRKRSDLLDAPSKTIADATGEE